MQKISLALVCITLLFTACKKEALLETNKDLNPTNLTSKQTTSNGGSSTQTLLSSGSKTISVASSADRLQCTTSISSDFNGNSIGAGKFIWFNSVMKVSGVGTTPVTINFYSQTITSSRFSVSVPDAVVTIDPATSTATTTYNGTSWVSTFPKSFSGNVFLSGVGFQVPAGGLPGGINPVTWSGSVGISDDNVKVDWQWGAAVYNNFSTNPASLGIKPCDDDHISVYRNSDHAGTPENYKSSVTGGARGGGGSNYTGSYSSTGKFTCTPAPPQTCPNPCLSIGTNTFCGGGTFTGTITPDCGGPGDLKGNTGTASRSGVSSGASSLTGTSTVSDVTTTWTFEGQTYHGNNVSITMPNNTGCDVIYKIIDVSVVCNATGSVIYHTTINVIINPNTTSTVTVDNSSCTGNIQFSCPNVTDVTWTIGSQSGTGTIVPLSSAPDVLNYSYSAYGCTYTGSVNGISCLPGLKNNQSNNK